MSCTKKLALVLVAGGSSTRMGGTLPKPFIKLHNKRVIDYSIDVYSMLPELEEICVVCASEYRTNFPAAITFADPGTRRQDSVYNGLQALKSAANLVAIHDAARPLVNLDTIKKVIEAAAANGSALAAVPVKSTIKVADEESRVAKTPNRSSLWEAQTPQIFKRELLIEAYHSPVNADYEAVDDASLVERIGHSPKLVMGNYSNIKLTTLEDLLIAQSFVTAS